MQVTEYPFCEKRFYNLIFITLSFCGESVIALFDTGASVSLISESLAAKFRCASAGELSAGNNNGATFALRRVTVDRIEIGGLSADNVLCGVLPDGYFDFGTDGEGNTFPAQMFLGWDIISRFSWRVDMRARAFGVSGGGLMPSNNALSYGNFPLIEINYRGQKFAVGFDTGHTETLLDDSWRNRLDNTRVDFTETAGVGSTLTEQVLVSDNFRFQWSLQEFCLKQVTVFQHAIYGADGVSGLLGIDFFENSVFEIDFESKRFDICKNA